SVLSKVEPKNFKSAIGEDFWFQAMQDEIHEFDLLQVWELVPQPDRVMIIALKWIYKVKLDEYGDVLKNKARLVAKGYRKEEDLLMDEDMAPDEQAQSSNDEDIRSAHIPKVNLRQDWWKPLEVERPATPEPTWSIPSSDLPVPTTNWASALASNYSPLPENSLLAQTGDIAMFMDWFYKRRGITELKPQDLEGPSFEIIKVFHPDLIHLQY
nr:retrovirus-related Pol polyprotein from transposon TNT 1-94 [Tanacetum cinerariifolium]